MRLHSLHSSDIYFAVFVAVALLFIVVEYPTPLATYYNPGQIFYNPPTLLFGPRVQNMSSCSLKTITLNVPIVERVCATLNYDWNATLLTPGQAYAFWVLHGRNVSKCAIPAVWRSNLRPSSSGISLVPLNATITVGLLAYSGTVYFYGDYDYTGCLGTRSS